MVTRLILEKEIVGFIFFFSVPISYTQQIDESFKQRCLLIKADNVAVAFANQKLKFDVRKTEKIFCQSALFFK